MPLKIKCNCGHSLAIITGEHNYDVEDKILDVAPCSCHGVGAISLAKLDTKETVIENRKFNSLCNLVIKLTELRQKECSYLHIEHFAPELFAELISVYVKKDHPKRYHIDDLMRPKGAKND